MATRIRHPTIPKDPRPYFKSTGWKLPGKLIESPHSTGQIITRARWKKPFKPIHRNGRKLGRAGTPFVAATHSRKCRQRNV